MALNLKYANIEWTQEGALLQFNFSGIGPCYTWPHPDQYDYLLICDRLGYGDDLRAYAREHDLIHEMLAEHLWDIPSPVLLGVAQGREQTAAQSCCEEAMVQSIQAYIRQGVRPILSFPDLLDFKLRVAEAIYHLDREWALLDV